MIINLNGVSYGDGGYDDNKHESKYLAWIERAGIEVKRVLKDDGSLFLNVGSTPTNPWIAMDVASVLRKYFILQNVIHWTKGINIKKSDVGVTTGLKGDKWYMLQHICRNNRLSPQ